MKDLELHAVFSFKTNTSNCIERVLREVVEERRDHHTTILWWFYWHILYTVLSSVKSDTFKFLRGAPWKGNTICLLNLEKDIFPSIQPFLFHKIAYRHNQEHTKDSSVFGVMPKLTVSVLLCNCHLPNHLLSDQIAICFDCILEGSVL